MTTRAKINTLLSVYENYIGTGNMKQAGRTLPKIVHALMEFVENYDTMRKQERQVYTMDNIPPDLAQDILAGLDELRAPRADDEPEKLFESPAPCVQCDVSIPNNPDLIEEFKNPLEAVAEKATELVGDMEVDLEEEIKGDVDLTETPEPEVETSAEVKEVTVPAPKTPKKPKAAT
jgi:hypothetical protein